MDNPKIKIESDGITAVVYLNGKHIKGKLIDFSFHGDAENNIHIKWDGTFLKRDEKGRPCIENDEIVTEEFHYDSDRTVFE